MSAIRLNGPLGYGSVLEETAFDVLDTAWTAGIRWIDTASSYGGGNGYKRLADWQAKSSLRFHLIVKPGRPLINGQPATRLQLEDLIIEISRAEAILGSPSVILIKDPPKESFRDQSILSIMDEVATRFPLAKIGLASCLLSECATLPITLVPRIVQVEYHGINWLTATPIISALAQKGWLIWGMQPLAYGFLGGRYSAKSVFPDDDWRRQIPQQYQTMLAIAAKSFIERLTALVSGVPPSVLSIAFCLTNPNVERIVIGPKTKSQLDDALAALALSETSLFRELIADLMREAYV